MATPHSNPISGGRVLGDELLAVLAPALDEATGLAMAETDPTVRAIGITQALTRIWVHLDELGPMRQEAIRRMRYPGGDHTAATTPPAMGWKEIATAVGLTPSRAQQIAALPGDRTAPRAPGAGRKPRTT